jgi:uncharacterized protein (TIGR03437 family)
MKQLRARWNAIPVLIPYFFALGTAWAQTSTTVTRIDTQPPGGAFYVDGVSYQGSTTAVWPAFSKHTLFILNPSQALGTGTQAVFTGWSWTGNGASPDNPLVISADPTITEYTANFSLAYALTLDCSNIAGTVLANGTAIPCGQSFFAAGGTVTLTATPNDGYVFAGWSGGPYQSVLGGTDIVTMNAPVQVTPMFQSARQVNLVTNPTGLGLLADGAVVITPYTAQWGSGSVHNVGPVSPQQDNLSNWWVFSSWSDGGAANHAYTVSGSSVLSANFVPGVTAQFSTSPVGLSLTIDGRSNWTSYTFIWGVGQSHTFSAPTQQTDSQGRVWNFSGWSNGGAASQSIAMPGSGLNLVATYTPMAQLTVNSSLAGLTVTVDGNACATPCSVVRTPGAQVDVSAPLSVPVATGARQDLLGWSTGAGPGDLILTLGPNPVTVSANYHLMNYLAAISSPSGGVTWNMQPASSDGYYDSQTTVGVSVSPLAGYKFVTWSGDLSGSSLSGSLAMNTPRSIQANLAKVPYVPPSAVVNGAGTGSNSGVAPGSVISIFGLNLAPGAVVGPSSPLAQTLGGATVHIADRLLPLFFVSPTQINVQLPADVVAGSQTLTLSAMGQADVQANFTVVQDAPGLFQQSVNGQSLAVAFHADGSAITSTAPAQQGETVTVYGTGFGPTMPARPEGLPVSASPQLVLTDPVTVQLGSATFTPVSGFAVPGVIGIDAVQFVLGDGATAANNQLTVTVNGQQSNTVLLPMQ